MVERDKKKRELIRLSASAAVGLMKIDREKSFGVAGETMKRGTQLIGRGECSGDNRIHAPCSLNTVQSAATSTQGPCGLCLLCDLLYYVLCACIEN